MCQPISNVVPGGIVVLLVSPLFSLRTINSTRVRKRTTVEDLAGPSSLLLMSVNLSCRAPSAQPCVFVRAGLAARLRRFLLARLALVFVIHMLF